MNDWLIANGPIKQVKKKRTQAQTAESLGQLGKAFTLYDQAARMVDGHELCQSAHASAEAIFRHAQVQLNAASNKSYAQTRKRLNQIARTYADSVIADIAQQREKDLVNVKADELEARARAAEEEKDYALALQLYELYLNLFPDAKRYSEVKAHVEILRTKAPLQ